MDFYADMAATAHELLTEFGGPVVLSRTVPGAYNPATGATGAGETTNYTGTGAAFDYGQRDIDGSRIRVGDRRVYLSTTGMVTPQTGDVLTLEGGEVLNVVASRPLKPAATVVMHDVQARGI